MGTMSCAAADLQTKIVMEDPSEYRPEYKGKEDFRNFDIHTTPERVVKVSIKICSSFGKFSSEPWFTQDQMFVQF